MIKEILTYFLTPTVPLAKKYGFLYQSIALEERFKRCQRPWLEHLKNCQDLFLEVCQELPQKEHVVVLGSSHLHEIPWHLLSSQFKKITLVDIIHPLKHHRLQRKFAQLNLITLDLTQALDQLESVKNFEDLTALASLEPQWEFSADLIISGNILSQLALLPLETLERKTKTQLTVEQKDQICSAFANRHLETLKRCQGQKLVYADRKTFYHDPKGEIIYEGGYSVDFSDFKKIKEWNWNLAPLKEASKNYSISMLVEAYSLDS